MASSSANPLAAELTADEIATRDAEAVVKYDEGVALIKVVVRYQAHLLRAYLASLIGTCSQPWDGNI